MNEKIVLASASPRRLEILQKAGFTPEILLPDIDEDLKKFSKISKTLSGHEACMLLATKKALAAENIYLSNNSTSITPDTIKELPIIIAADTIVYNGKIIGKPVGEEDAFNMLNELRSKVHHVMSGVCILIPGTKRRRVFYEKTEVFFKDYSDDFLNKYVKTPEPYDKAGGYAIQGKFAKFVDHYNGDYDNVVGFPLRGFLKEVQKL